MVGCYTCVAGNDQGQVPLNTITTIVTTVILKLVFLGPLDLSPLGRGQILPNIPYIRYAFSLQLGQQFCDGSSSKSSRRNHFCNP